MLRTLSGAGWVSCSPSSEETESSSDSLELAAGPRGLVGRCVCGQEGGQDLNIISGFLFVF